MPTTITTTGTKDCHPFLLKVGIYSPEAGYKFDVTVQLVCSAENTKTWKLLFHLFKKVKDDFVQIVSVEFEAETPQETKALETMSEEGVKIKQARALRQKVHPLVRDGADEKIVHKAIGKALLAES